ncbi:Exoglucanase 1 [Salinomyces thailandicus]|uniref:Glucanase n=1 Tax=Salinomyces thailandicus TaxID=706561 RepID=A0A4U0TK15_9PEZI|nr:Exoglucanase 1 [Salinomyces thailandica]
MSLEVFLNRDLLPSSRTQTAENHPALSYQQCTDSGCTTVDTAVVLDANWRWLHTVDGYTNCYTGQDWETSLCPDADTCAENCALDGADYSGTYGISSSGDALTLDFVTGSNVGSRVYLINGDEYEMFMLKNMEFTFDVDVSNLPCGLNGALYFVKMDADGGLSEYSGNSAGADYGTGYCDAQCPQDLKFIGGEANVEGWVGSSTDANSGTGDIGSCCTEMDIWEANSISNAVTPHVCSTDGPCTTAETCGTGDDRYDGYCDKDGCDFNPYRWGNETFYGPDSSYTIDTNSVITVVTQFITDDGTASGTLTEIRRIYVQDGEVIQQANTNIEGITTTNEITDEFCTETKEVTGDEDKFGELGGFSTLSDEMDAGMVLVMSIWDDHTANMLWLDSTYPTDDPDAVGAARGTCATTSGDPDDVESNSPGSSVVFSNIKFGTLNSTYSA